MFRVDDATVTLTEVPVGPFRSYVGDGGFHDHLTGLVRFGARDYDAETGRWTAKDPILFRGGGTNLFANSGNDPVNRKDPTGLIVRVAGSEQSSVWAMLADMAAADPALGLFLDELEESEATFWITADCNTPVAEDRPGDTVCGVESGSCSIAINPDNAANWNAPLRDVLQHELGHILGLREGTTVGDESVSWDFQARGQWFQ
jgi:RHS repeat-associated protein